MAALAKAKRDGLARHIGVANFNIALLDEAIALCPEPLVNLQGEGHPYIDTTKIVDACRARGIVFTAYCPLGRGRLFEDPVLGEIAKAKGRSLAQVALRWLIQRGNIVPIPRSSNPGRLAETSTCSRSRCHDDEMARIGALKKANGRIANPPGRAPKSDYLDGFLTRPVRCILTAKLKRPPQETPMDMSVGLLDHYNVSTRKLPRPSISIRTCWDSRTARGRRSTSPARGSTPAASRCCT